MNVAYLFTDGRLPDARPLPPTGEWLVQQGHLDLHGSGLRVSRTVFQALHRAAGHNLHLMEVEDIVDELPGLLVARRLRFLGCVDSRPVLLASVRLAAHQAAYEARLPVVVSQWLESRDSRLTDSACRAMEESRSDLMGSADRCVYGALLTERFLRQGDFYRWNAVRQYAVDCLERSVIIRRCTVNCAGRVLQQLADQEFRKLGVLL